MKTDKLKNDTRSAYASPVSKVVYVKVQGCFCQSLYGDPNAPGAPLSENPGNTYNY